MGIREAEVNAALIAEVQQFRRDMHAHPELAFDEHRAAARVAQRLSALPGLSVHTGLAGTGVVATLQGERPGPAIGLRADLDALALTERSGVAHASTHPGRMHACGHDGHTAMLLGAALSLSAAPRFAGTVHFIFQPAEENEGGGRRMVEEGLFERFPCAQVFGLHNWPGLAAGHLAMRAGPMMAAFDRFEARLIGRGGHAAMPHQGRDPVHAAAQAVVALQSLVSRETDPLDAAVVSVTRIEGGATWNVIPDEATLGGTARALKPSVRDAIEAGISRVIHGVAAAFDLRAEVHYTRCYPPTVNTPESTALAQAAATALVGGARVHTDLPPSMGAEDFAFLLEQRPGCYAWLGVGEDHPRLHNPHYDFNDAVLSTGIGYWRGVVAQALGAQP
jgi:hippurate hydrolase